MENMAPRNVTLAKDPWVQKSKRKQETNPILSLRTQQRSLFASKMVILLLLTPIDHAVTFAFAPDDALLVRHILRPRSFVFILVLFLRVEIVR